LGLLYLFFVRTSSKQLETGGAVSMYKYTLFVYIYTNSSDHLLTEG